MNFMGSQGPRNSSTGSLRARPNFSGDVIPKGYRTGQLQQYTPEQLELFGQQFSNVGPDSYLARLAGADPSLFEEMEAPALRQFSGLAGGLANRFATGSGRRSLGNLRSSGFQNTGTAAASNFAQELQANRQGLQRQGIRDLMEISNMLLGQRPYERTIYQKPEKQSSGFGGLIGAGLGGVGGFFAGGPMGALQGAQLGYGIGSAF